MSMGLWARPLCIWGVTHDAMMMMVMVMAMVLKRLTMRLVLYTLVATITVQVGCVPRT